MIIPLTFLSTPSARRATGVCELIGWEVEISIHALREEGDCKCSPCGHTTVGFLSTPSARRATFFPLATFKFSCYFYPRPPRGGRPSQSTLQTSCGIFLSTPSARRATHLVERLADGWAISIHALREEGDDFASDYVLVHDKFLSTPSARRATKRVCDRCGYNLISIHALREEGDGWGR